MYAEIAADPMPSAMVIVEPFLPQRTAGEGVELGPGGPFRKTRQSQRDMPLEHAREAVAHLLRRLPDRYRAGHVGGAVEILRSGIEQIEATRLQALLGLRRRPVMDDC